MHDGSLATLAEVVSFFDDKMRLGLAAAQKSDLVAYLEAVGAGTMPFETGDAAQVAARDRAVMASTLDTLLARRDRFHTMLLIRSLAPALGARFESIGEAVLAEDWDLAARRWDAYRKPE
jgi:hypothetical protein